MNNDMLTYDFIHIGCTSCLIVKVNRVDGKIRISDINDNYTDMDREEVACLVDILKRALKGE